MRDRIMAPSQLRGSVFSFSGRIDGVRIYNRALTGAEIMALFDARSA